MTMAAIQEEISHLTEEERWKLYDWFSGLQNDEWDREMERDFAPGGRGEHLLAKVEAQIDHALAEDKLTSLKEGLLARREKRSQE